MWGVVPISHELLLNIIAWWAVDAAITGLFFLYLWRTK
jgi:hypothetical protein